MASRISASSTLEASIQEAERSGASAEEARKVHNAVSANTSPNIVRGFELEFGSDSTNSRAVWVHLIVDPELNPTQERISELSSVANKVRLALLDQGLDSWPYVDFRGRP